MKKIRHLAFGISLMVVALSLVGLTGCRESRVTSQTESGIQEVTMGDLKDKPATPGKGDIVGVWEAMVIVEAKSHDIIEGDLLTITLEFFEEEGGLFVKGVKELITEAVPVEYVEQEDYAIIDKFALKVGVDQPGVDYFVSTYEMGPFALRLIEKDNRVKSPEQDGLAPYRQTLGADMWVTGMVTLIKQ